ncbi:MULTISPECIES: type II toxin-antitoxin system mRNA interferase toxin, RelE/StbE family [Burkholderia cepacia complex]|uniref:type II toxin-antitoxin system RelE/ParE family toxin n=1 Tax=Burkholderia cepacia complex TaxID=87882 RepID=UPI00098EEBF0|nr:MULTISPECIES: type II toxin-antitoxin system mRNA interferase toxin, RelE/StbE family [Burkholderia cepacia complex]AQT48752.1 addiction module antitoxin [Burkholderia cenocepacia]MBJ9727793.1 type II toxin-antitoxin system mRNA interferase toxin, RelE/StbE family [Burkholderia cenocepacia]MBJ9923820.1 type II toxin-antitoxin system mRNA interferase toxin, RelE/StbE family [Burkholderia cenocepacia]MDN7533427.1 type II toxin-antitoxin system mRNA interferase toxin, RelE/StbE family [Burkhold
MTLALHWNPKAYEDRAAIMEYIAEDDPLAALELDELLEERAAALPAHAELYRQGRVAGTRELVVAPNYVLVYRLRPAEDIVEILRVLHARRQWP